MFKFKSVALQMDAVATLRPATDTSLALAREAQDRGAALFTYEPRHMKQEITRDGVVISALVRSLTLRDGEDWFALGEGQWRALTDFNVILMRQDPPFDLAYIAATHMLDHVKDQTRVINCPTGVRNAPEKLLITHFPQLMPPTLISRELAAINDFRKQHGEIIIKPLFGFGGHGIFHLRADDDNLAALIELWSGINREPWMVQKYLPEILTAGDKRIILIDGEPVGGYSRLPAAGDARANGRVGGSAKLAPLTPRDREICMMIKPVLQRDGLFLAGIDVIGDYLTEINVTSPTGLPVLDRLEKRSGSDRCAAIFWDRLAK